MYEVNHFSFDFFRTLSYLRQVIRNYLKQITLIRHAKSSWDNPTLRDFDRPLNKRGEKDAPFMGSKLLEEGVKFDQIISSPAKRTTLTIEKICPKINFPIDQILWEESLFHSSMRNVLQLLSVLDDDINSAAIVGHNPSITDTANFLQNDLHIDNIPTAGIISIKYDIDDWTDILDSKGTLSFYIYPKKFR